MSLTAWIAAAFHRALPASHDLGQHIGCRLGAPLLQGAAAESCMRNLMTFSPSPRTRGEGGRRPDEGLRTDAAMVSNSGRKRAFGLRRLGALHPAQCPVEAGSMTPPTVLSDFPRVALSAKRAPGTMCRMPLRRSRLRPSALATDLHLHESYPQLVNKNRTTVLA